MIIKLDDGPQLVRSDAPVGRVLLVLTAYHDRYPARTWDYICMEVLGLGQSVDKHPESLGHAQRIKLLDYILTSQQVD